MLTGVHGPSVVAYRCCPSRLGVLSTPCNLDATAIDATALVFAHSGDTFKFDDEEVDFTPNFTFKGGVWDPNCEFRER